MAKQKIKQNNTWRTTPLTVQEGAVKIGCCEALVHGESDTLVALELSFESKYANIDGLMSDSDP